MVGRARLLLSRLTSHHLYCWQLYGLCDLSGEISTYMNGYFSMLGVTYAHVQIPSTYGILSQRVVPRWRVFP